MCSSDLYKQLDLEYYFFEKCKGLSIEYLERVAIELVLFDEYGLNDLLKTLIYLIDEFKKMNIVWGIGRGSSCSSLLLYLIDSQEVDCVNLGLAEDQLQVVLAGMEDACSAGGTGYPFFAWNTQVRQEGLNFKEQLANGAVACKTGTAEFGGTDERGYKKTHGWFVMGMGVSKILAQSLATLSEESTDSAKIVLGSKDLDFNYKATSAAQTPAVIERYLNHTQWLHMVQKHGFPDTIAIVVLVESDEDRPYREGSADAGPVDLLS